MKIGELVKALDAYPEEIDVRIISYWGTGMVMNEVEHVISNNEFMDEPDHPIVCIVTNETPSHMTNN